MPHLIETYALNCGLKIDEPSILEKYYPINLDNYITLHPKSKYGSKCYDYWQEVVDIISKPLAKKDIHIVQLGSKDDPAYNKCQHTQGSTNIGQVAYIIKNSALHLGVDSFPTHVASKYKKKIVCLYSNTYSDVVGPYWGEEKDQILIEPELTKERPRPSFSAEESPKSINDIKPEDIASCVFELLGIKYENKLTTVSRGPTYLPRQVEAVPDAVVDIAKVGIDSLIIRMDYLFNEQVLLNQLARNPCSIVTDKPINPSIFGNLKKHLIQLVYMVDKDHDPAFIEECHKLGIPFLLLSKLEGKELESAKLYYMDYATINKQPQPKAEDIKEAKEHGIKNLFYKSNKFLIGDGKLYPSKAAWEEKLPTDQLAPKIFPVIDKDSFWEKIEDYYILKK